MGDSTQEYEALLKLTSHFPTYSKSVLKIQTMQGELVPFEINKPQEILEEIVRKIQKQNRLCRLVILKARREGVSTWTAGRYYWNVSTKPNKYAMIVAHEPEASDTIFKMVKRFYLNAPEYFKPAVKYSNQKLLEFNAEGGGLDSAFRVATADKEDLGSGQTIHYLHLSEMAKYAKSTQQALLTSLLQCVPDKEDTMIIMESTAKGVGGEFHRRYFNSRYRYTISLKDGEPYVNEIVNESVDEDNSFSSIFIPWFVFPEYKKTPSKNFEPTENEKLLAHLHGLTNEHLAWRRWAIENRCGGSEDIFNQEYPSDDLTCFLSSGDSVFDTMYLNELKKEVNPPKIRYDCLVNSGQWVQRDFGPLRVWKEPENGKRYVIGADVASGVKGGDNSSADVIDSMTGEQVAQWHGKTDPDLFGKILYWLGRRYNFAYMAVERNGPGITTLNTLDELRYPKLHFEQVPEPPGKVRKRFGWVTTKVTKGIAINNLVKLVRDREHGIVSTETIDELISFRYYLDGNESEKMGAADGSYDDRVMSYAIAQYVKGSLPVSASQDAFFSNSPVAAHVVDSDISIHNFC